MVSSDGLKPHAASLSAGRATACGSPASRCQPSGAYTRSSAARAKPVEMPGSCRWPQSADGRPRQATNGRFADAEREGSEPVVGQLRSTPMDWVGTCRPPSKVHRRKAALEAALPGSSRSPVRDRDPQPPFGSLRSCPMLSAGLSCFASTKQPLVTSGSRPQPALGDPLRISPAGPPWMTGLRRPT